MLYQKTASNGGLSPRPWKEVESGILPLMVVEQPTKDKVRPVLDFRKLNVHVECHTGDDVTDMCSEILREWRRTDGEATIVDLKPAYLQIRVAKELWKIMTGLCPCLCDMFERVTHGRTRDSKKNIYAPSFN